MTLPRELRRPAFWLPFGLYLLYYGNGRFLHWPVPPLVASYFSDLLAMPVILTLALAVQRRWVQRNPTFTLPDAWLLGALLYVSAWFELVMPWLSGGFVGDWLDVVAYGVGTLFFRQLLNRPA